MIKKKRVAFLFGAGAESNFGLPSGDCFFNLTLPEDKLAWHESILEALKEKFDNDSVLERYPDWLTKYRKEIVTKKEIKKNKDNSYGILERLFHTIINPKEYGKNKFWKVFNFYWFAYFAILEPLVYRCGEDKTHLKLNQDSNIYALILDNLEDFTNKIYKERWNYTFEDHFYYNNEYYSDNSLYEVTGILTTNYTPLVYITEICKSKIAYLNGRLNQFEYPNELVIKDFTEYERDVSDFYFPFVMAQSALKPIIAPQQIKEYNLASYILEMSDVLVIIGYNINEDDNHVNSYIVDFLRRNSLNKVIYCKYAPSEVAYNEKDCHSEICKRLRLAKYDEQIQLVKNGGDPADLFSAIIKTISDNDISCSS